MMSKRTRESEGDGNHVTLPTTHGAPSTSTTDVVSRPSAGLALPAVQCSDTAATRRYASQPSASQVTFLFDPWPSSHPSCHRLRCLQSRESAIVVYEGDRYNINGGVASDRGGERAARLARLMERYASFCWHQQAATEVNATREERAKVEESGVAEEFSGLLCGAWLPSLLGPQADTTSFGCDLDNKHDPQRTTPKNGGVDGEPRVLDIILLFFDKLTLLEVALQRNHFVSCDCTRDGLRDSGATPSNPSGTTLVRSDSITVSSCEVLTALHEAYLLWPPLIELGLAQSPHAVIAMLQWWMQHRINNIPEAMEHHFSPSKTNEKGEAGWRSAIWDFQQQYALALWCAITSQLRQFCAEMEAPDGASGSPTLVVAGTQSRSFTAVTPRAEEEERSHSVFPDPAPSVLQQREDRPGGRCDSVMAKSNERKWCLPLLQLLLGINKHPPFALAEHLSDDNMHVLHLLCSIVNYWPHDRLWSCASNCGRRSFGKWEPALTGEDELLATWSTVASYVTLIAKKLSRVPPMTSVKLMRFAHRLSMLEASLTAGEDPWLQLSAFLELITNLNRLVSAASPVG